VSDRSSLRLESDAAFLQARAWFRLSMANDCWWLWETVVMGGRARVTSRVVAELREQVGPRDQAVMATLARVRLATGRQLERVHWTDAAEASRSRQQRRALARLVSLRVLTRLDRRIGGIHAGSSGHVFALDIAGQRLLDHGGPAGGARWRTPWTPGSPFVSHVLAVSELYVQLIELTRTESIFALLAFDAEPTCWRSFSGPHGGRITLKPDVFLILATPEYEDRYFIEVDRSTESPRVLARKAEFYRQYWQSGREQAQSDVFPRVLFLVPDETRKAVVVNILERQPQEAWVLYQVGLFAEAMSIFRAGAAT